MRLLICCFVLAFTGCGQSTSYSGYQETYDLEQDLRLAEPQEKVAESSSSKKSKRADQARRIIFEADIELIVEDFSSSEQKLRNTVKNFGGYMANVQVHRVALENSTRRGTWTARVPVENFEGFLKAVRELGTTATITQDAKDVTMEYVDLNSRIANKQKLEERISELLGNSRGSVQELVKIEHELSRIREEIEMMQGRLRKLKDLSAVTTVSITVVEEKPEPVVAIIAPPVPLTFAQRVDEAWTASVDSARQVYEDLIVWLAGNFILVIAWMVSMLVVLLVLRIIYKFIWPALIRNRVNDVANSPQ